jgi:tryptophan-rich hypothetical protein
MTNINPKKLLNSKWTAVTPKHREKHFLVTDIEFDEDGNVLSCSIEAIMSKRTELIDWQILKNEALWIQGWQ